MRIVVLSERVLFSGEAASASTRGGVITVRCQSGPALFDCQLPRFRVQPGCNHTLFSPGCGLAREEWKFTALVLNPGTPGYPFEFVLGSLERAIGPAPTYFEHWFAGGWIELGTGPTWCRCPILRSSTVVDGGLTVTLGRDPKVFPGIADPVVLYPGCDGRFETCGPYNDSQNPEGKFANRVNFGGHPFVPPANPSLVKTSEAVGGGKKS